MLKNDWLELEEKQLTLEILASRKRELTRKSSGIKPVIFFLLIAAGILSSFSSAYAQGRGLWGDTWACKQCGYENYVGIERCPVCGTKK